MLATIKKYQHHLYPAALLLASLLSYCTLYGLPNSLFWDENYHIASAQKHLDGVMYMEPHPPLGKMLLALGEAIVNPNADLDKSAFNSTDYITGNQVPEGFSFAGFRLMSVLLMAFSVLFLYGLRSEEHTSELQSREKLVCRLLLEKKNVREHGSMCTL